MKIKTRPAVESDKEFARITHHLAYHDVVLNQYGRWDETSQDEFFDQSWSQSPHDILIVDDITRGYTSVEKRPNDLYLRELVIHPEHQNLGIGSGFLANIIELSVQEEMPIRLQTHINNRAAGLYQRIGFREYDRTNTHILMVWDKSLAQSH